jgi:hypothetical protein
MTDAVRTTSLIELVQRVAFRLGDAVFLQSTSTGDTTQFRDAVNIPMGNENLTGRQLIFSSGDELGTIVSITNTQHDSHTVTFNPPVSPAVPSGVTAFVINKRSGGYTWLEYVRGINMAISDSYPNARTVNEHTVTFNDALGYIAIDTTGQNVTGISFLDDDDLSYVEVPAATHTGYDGWEVNPSTGRIIVNSDWYRGIMADRSIRVRTEGRHSELATYSETTKLHPGWIVAQACYHLALMGMDRDISGQRGRQVLSYQQEADKLFPLIKTYQHPVSRRGRV